MSEADEDYRAVAKALGVRYLFGRYGLQFFPRDPNGKIYKIFQFVPLDGWISDPHEITQALLDDPAFEVTLGDKPTQTKGD